MDSIDKALLNESESSDQFIRKLMSSLILSTRASNNLPSGDGTQDYDYYCTFPKFADEANNSAKSAAEKIQDLTWWISPDSGIDLPGDLLDSNLYEQVVDVIDSLLEKADHKLDEITNKKQKATSSVQLSLTMDKDRLIASNCINQSKPQLKFNDEIDNRRETIFIPRIQQKANSLAPLDLKSYQIEADEANELCHNSQEKLLCRAPKVYHRHPYEYELHQLQYRSWQLEVSKELSLPCLPISQPFEFINTEEALYRAADELEQCREIAVDLEHHSYRSFQGITCLMQISSRIKNYVIDTLALRRHMSILLRIFTNSDIVKVFHGCDSDILWLQRDFGLYIINCFDTYQSAKILKYPALSLAHLLKFHCNIILNKKYQLSDWRQRPLSEEMINYARDDTHYLLHIYDVMKSAIIKSFGTQGIVAVLDASKRTCLQRYEKEIFKPYGYLRLLELANSRRGGALATALFSGGGKKVGTENISQTQDMALSALWDWRDAKARRDDESLTYIMSNAELLRIGLQVPRDESSLLTLCRPLSSIAVSHAKEIVEAISARLQDGEPVPYEMRAAGPSASGLSDFPVNPGSTGVSCRSSQSLGDRDRDREGSRDSSIKSVHGPEADTVFTFTPALTMNSSVRVSPSSASGGNTPDGRGGGGSGRGSNSGFVSPTHSLNLSSMSPVLGTDEMFRLAGWKTPLPSGEGYEVGMINNNNVISEPLRDMVEEDDTQRRYEKVMEGLRKQNGQTKSNKTPEWSLGDELEEDLVDVREEEPYGEEEMEEQEESSLKSIPKTLEDIYVISNRNRKRNKNRKRQQGGRGEGENEGEEETLGEETERSGQGTEEEGTSRLKSSTQQMTVTGGGENGSDPIEDFYFGSGTKELDTDVDNRVEFMQGVGWLSSDLKEKLAVLETHMREEAERADSGTHTVEERGESGKSHNRSAQQSHNPNTTKTNQKPASPIGRGAVRSDASYQQTGAGAGAGDRRGVGKPQQKSQGQTSSHMKEFDYTQHSLGPMGAMGAMSGPQSQAYGANPYLQQAPVAGGGTAPRGGSAPATRTQTEHGTKPGHRKAGSGGQAHTGSQPQQMEKKDRDRTMTFSTGGKAE